MESNPSSRLIPVSEISKEDSYGIRFDYQDPRLESSLEKKGILSPLVLVSKEKGSVNLVSGHKRFFYALRKGWKEVPACLIQEQFSEKELFLLSVYSNWNQNFSDLDRMLAIRKGEESFGCSREELREEVLPALGIQPNRGVLEDYRKVSGLAGEIHDLIHGKKLPFRGAASLALFSKEEQSSLAKTVFARVHLTANQLILISEWLLDLKRIEKASLEALIKDPAMGILLENSKMDPRTRGDRIFAALRRLRFPKLSEEEKNFDRLKSQLEGAEEIQLERPGGFESEGIFLRARLKNHDSLDRIFRFLETHRSSLESFL